MEMPRPLIYLSHPFSVNPEGNRDDAREKIRRLASETQGYIFINPLDLFLGQSSVMNDEEILSQAIEIMLHCDGVIFTNGYEESKGCMAEYKAAKKAGIPIWFGTETFLTSLEWHYDEIGGFHGGGCGTSPEGEFCGECSESSCVECQARQVAV